MFKRIFKKKKNLTLRHHLVASSHSKSVIAEQYRTVRTNIEYSAIDKDIKSILVTSATPGDGKSTTSCNLAIVFAQQGKKVLLVDTDLRKPTVHKKFCVHNHIGLSSVLTKKHALTDAIIETSIENLSILTSGPIPPNPAELLTSKSMEHLLEMLGQEFDLIILDTPPVLAVSDAQILSKHVDGVVLVVSYGKTETEQGKKAKQLLVSSNAPLLGVVLNNKKQEKNDYYYYYGHDEKAI
ncbi:CpsD/CapB family tyrosine-protein kinase [Bacillus sp. AGMB 02131]|uniref:non-specific protein-tyrosine kinase n=1 Tax=Peribacillus faecalis TaxID=2772559 RepID=A0A927CYD7_9BACI|nr:CpsD/CapB family tyrosine-protein kinase [Peribacillus faecalis]MBD3107609.1 CpsD/CapB family tyrosine-protein kinase [Peribacillus faecalis]